MSTVKYSQPTLVFSRTGENKRDFTTSGQSLFQQQKQEKRMLLFSHDSRSVEKNPKEAANIEDQTNLIDSIEQSGIIFKLQLFRNLDRIGCIQDTFRPILIPLFESFLLFLVVTEVLKIIKKRQHWSVLAQIVSIQYLSKQFSAKKVERSGFCDELYTPKSISLHFIGTEFLDKSADLHN